MIIALSHYKTTYTIETKNDDVSAQNVIEYFISIMKSAGWGESSIQNAVFEISENYHKDV